MLMCNHIVVVKNLVAEVVYLVKSETFCCCFNSVRTRADVERVELQIETGDLLHIFGRKADQNFSRHLPWKKTASTPTVSQACGLGGPSEDNEPPLFLSHSFLTELRIWEEVSVTVFRTDCSQKGFNNRTNL